MKVLHIYSGNLFGGIETLLITLAKQRHLCPQMLPYFALCFEGRLAKELRATGAEVKLLGEVRTSRPWTVLRAQKELRQYLHKENFDIAICHACWPQAIFGTVVKASGLPLLFWCHDTLNGKHWLEKWAKRTLPDWVIANSRYTLTSVPLVYPKNNTSILYYPVSPQHVINPQDVRRKLRTELDTPEDAVVIIQVSRLEPWKGQTLLISALAQLQDVTNWVCWIAGGAQRPHEVEYLNSLHAQAQTLGVSERIRFLGQRSDVPKLLAAADIHCQPNTGGEPFGITFIEALYAGLPVVTTAIGGGAEIVNDACGRLVEPNNPGALSQALRELISNLEQREHLGSNSFARASALCDPAQQMHKLQQLLKHPTELETAA